MSASDISLDQTHPELLPLSGIQHFVFCPRHWALIHFLITYDVETTTTEGQRRLTKVAKCCKNYGQRVQNSVFECLLTEKDLITLRSALSSIINKETDSIRIYRLGNYYKTKIEQIGKETSFDIEGTLII